MRNDPQTNQLILTNPMRFSLGAGTQITSVHVKLSDIRLRDMPKDNSDKRAFALEVAEARARELHHDKYAPGPDGEGEPVTYMVTHREDSVTFEIWKHGPETRKVKLL